MRKFLLAGFALFAALSCLGQTIPTEYSYETAGQSISGVNGQVRGNWRLVFERTLPDGTGQYRVYATVQNFVDGAWASIPAKIQVNDLGTYTHGQTAILPSDGATRTVSARASTYFEFPMPDSEKTVKYVQPREIIQTLENPTDHPVTFTYREVNPDGSLGRVIQEVTLGPGEKTNVKISSNTGNPIKVFAEMPDVTVDANGDIVASPGTNLAWDAGTIAWADMTAASSITPLSPAKTVSVDKSKAPVAIQGGKATVEKGATGAVIQADQISGATTDALDKGTFVGGINALAGSLAGQTGEVVSAIDKLNATLAESGGSGGGSTDMGPTNTLIGGTNDRLDAVNTNLNALQVKVDQLATSDEEEQTLQDANPTLSQMQSDGEASRGTGESSVNSAMGSGPSVPSGNYTSPGASIFEISFMGHTMDLDPMHHSGVAALAGFVRNLLKWIIVVGFAWWAYGYVSELVIAATHAPQARGNAVLGGTGGQATALAAAAAITALLFALPALLMASTNTSLGLLSWAQISSENPLSTSDAILRGAVYLLDSFVPIDELFVVIVQAFSVRVAGLGVYVGTVSVIRHIVP